MPPIPTIRLLRLQVQGIPIEIGAPFNIYYSKSDPI